MDPRVINVLERNAKRKPSALIQALEAGKWEKVNFCPCGCEMEELDDHGYCHHLIGFTNETFTRADLVPGTNPPVFKGTQEGKPGKTYEPMVHTTRYERDEDGRLLKDDAGKLIKVEGEGRIVQVPKKKGEKGKFVPDLPFIQKGDILVEITTSWRVYRDMAKPGEADEADVPEEIEELEPALRKAS